jgi:predicted membrane-bound spermidine synthase
MHSKISAGQQRHFYAGVFVISAVLMSLQILQSRIFSVTTWYHLAFLVISVAMFGMTVAALRIYKQDEKTLRENHAKMMADCSLWFGWTILIALAAQLCFSIVDENFVTTLARLPAVSLLIVFPYYFAGQILSLALTRTPYPVEKTYGIDLLGAAAGCLFAVGLMEYVDAPSAVIVLSALAFACAYLFNAAGISWKKVAVVPVLLAVVVLNMALPQKIIYPYTVKGLSLPQSELTHDEWNSISRVTVSTEHVDAAPFFWGPSEKTPKSLKASHYELKIDGDAATPINRFDGDLKKASFLEYDVTTLAYSIPGLKKGAIIGVGGGRDALTALYFGLKDITALDINSVQISLLSQVEPYKTYAGLAVHPEIKFIHSEARSWFAHNQDKFDIIQMSLIDTWAATGAGAFSLSENGLYTVDAWRVFLADLKEDGVLTVSRWHTAHGENEMQRLLAMAAQALFDSGISEPWKHMFVAKGSNVATLVLSKAPFSNARLAALRGQVRARGFETLVDPDQNDPENPMARVVHATSPENLLQVVASEKYDLSPPDDNRPFFFNMVRLTNPMNIINLALGVESGSFLGHARATLNLFLILGFALFMVGFVILWPMRKTLNDTSPRYAANGTAWFLLIGLGFMLFEISLLQRMSVFLGHPVYSLGIVMFSLICATGLGSLLSGKCGLQTPAKRAGWALGTAGLMVLMPHVFTSAFTTFAESPLLARALICVALTGPMGILLGYGFPTGMKLAEATDTHPMPWFWGINGAAGVLGSVLAVALNIAYGLDHTMMIAALCYAALAVPGVLWHTKALEIRSV